VSNLNFEEALVYELETIPEINGKVYPLTAREGIEPPFVIYVSSEGEETQTLNGYADTKEITCEIHVVSDSYGEMKELTKDVIAKCKTFYGRQIGVDGDFIKSFTYIDPIEEHDEDFGYERSSFDIRVRI
jgi:hypothetical protein